MSLPHQSTSHFTLAPAYFLIFPAHLKLRSFLFHFSLLTGNFTLSAFQLSLHQPTSLTQHHSIYLPTTPVLFFSPIVTSTRVINAALQHHYFLLEQTLVWLGNHDKNTSHCLLQICLLIYNWWCLPSFFVLDFHPVSFPFKLNNIILHFLFWFVDTEVLSAFIYPNCVFHSQF